MSGSQGTSRFVGLADERQIIEDELTTERARRQQAEQERDATIAGRQRAETMSAATPARPAAEDT